MIVINILGGIFVMMAISIIVGNIIQWFIDQYDEWKRPPETPPKVEWWDE